MSAAPAATATPAGGRPRTMGQEAQRLARWFWVLPLLPGQKKPFGETPGSHMALRLRQFIAALWAAEPRANIGIATGRKLDEARKVIGIDVDAPSPSHGAADGRPYVVAHPHLFTETVTALTPTGGEHRYYSVPADLAITNRDGMFPRGINVRGEGGLLVAPPSLHPDGGRYQWAEGAAPWEREIADAPPALLALLCPPTDPAPMPQDAPAPMQADISDSELVAKARRARNGAKFAALFDHGSTSGHGDDDSAADEALACLLIWWTNHDLARAERLFGQSALARRDKWQRKDYRRRTLEHADTLVDGGYTGQPTDAPPLDPTDPVPQDAARGGALPIPEAEADQGLFAALETQLSAALKRALDAEARLAERNRDFLWLAHTLKNRAIPNGPKITMIAAYFEINGQRANGAQLAPAYILTGKKPDQPLAEGVPVSINHLAESSGQDTDTVSRHVKVLAEAGAWDRGWVTIPCENAPPQTQVQLAPKPDLYEKPHLLKLPEGAPKHGGARPKKEEPCENATCGPETVETEVHLVKVEIDRCQTCEEVQGAPRITGDVEIIQLIRESAPTEAPIPHLAARRSKRRIAQTPLVPALAQTAAAVRDMEQAEAHDPETRADEIRPLAESTLRTRDRKTSPDYCPDCGPFGCNCHRSARLLIVPTRVPVEVGAP